MPSIGPQVSRAAVDSSTHRKADIGAALGLALAHGVLEGTRLLRHGQGWSLRELWGSITLEIVLAWIALSVVFFCVGWARRRPVVQGLLVVGTLAVLQGAGAWVHPIPVKAPPPVGVDAPLPSGTVVLITADTLRRDHVSVYDGGQDLTPRLDALAAESLRFDDAVTTAPLTLPAHTTLLSGHHPSEHGIFRNGMVLPDDLVGLPRVLGESGYRTGAFVSSTILHGSHGMRPWFEVYRDALGTRVGMDHLLLAALSIRLRGLVREVPRDVLGKEPGAQTVSRALAWLDALPDGAPVFLWVHLYDAHAPHTDTQPMAIPTPVDPCRWSAHPTALRLTPWHPVRPIKRPLEAAERCEEMSWSGLRAKAEGYRGAVSHLDDQIGVLLDGLMARGRWDEARVIFVGDHGESLDEHQHYLTHQYSLYDPVVRVPLFVRVPGQSGVRSEGVTTARVAATLRDLAGLEPDPGLMGPSLLQRAEDHPIAVGPAPIGRRSQQRGASIQAVARWGGRKVLVDESGHVERYDLREDAQEASPGLTEAEQGAVQTLVAERLDPTSKSMGLMSGLTRAPLPKTRESLTQSGVLGTRLTEAQVVQYAEHEAAARDAIARLRGVLRQEGRSQVLSEEVRESLEALGYLQ